jgi:hypothetical protein
MNDSMKGEEEDEGEEEVDGVTDDSDLESLDSASQAAKKQVSMKEN